MDSFSLDLFNIIAKRAWKVSWAFILYFLISFFSFLAIIIYKQLYILDNVGHLSSNLLSLLDFLFSSSLLSLLFFIILYILKGDSDITIKKLRIMFYNKVKYRVLEVFKYRYENNFNYEKDIINLTTYCTQFSKDDTIHQISEKNLKINIISEVDSLYFIYEVSKEEKVLWSIWHSGDFIAIAIAIDTKFSSEEEIKTKLENGLNISNAKEYKLSKRDKYWWFDIKYDISEEFLFNNIEKEKISRYIAHIITVGLILSLEILGWQKK